MNYEEIRNEAIRVYQDLANGKVAKTTNEYLGGYYLKNASIKDFEIYKVKLNKKTKEYTITTTELFLDYENLYWLNFWNANDYLETSVFENCFLTIADEAFTIEQVKELQKNGNLVYENRYEKGKKSFGIVKNNEHFSIEKIKWLNFWNGEQLAQDIKKVNFNSLKELSDYILNNQGKYFYDTYKKGVLK